MITGLLDRMNMKVMYFVNIVNTQVLIFLSRVRRVKGGMGWVHHAWLSCNPPICWMRQNMANGHPDSGGHVITSLRHGVQCLDKMTHNVHNVDTLPGGQRTEARLLSIREWRICCFNDVGHWSAAGAPLTFSIRYSDIQSLIFTETWLSRILER